VDNERKALHVVPWKTRQRYSLTWTEKKVFRECGVELARFDRLGLAVSW